jgi:succinate dehydrogenase flavin-adding protein (antitoxin of CptAB toxin-antitoxin module)
LTAALLTEAYHLPIDDQDICKMLRYAGLRTIYDVMTRFRNEGLRGMSKEDRKTYRRILDLDREDVWKRRREEAERLERVEESG